MFGFGRARREATQIGAAAARVAIMPFWRIEDRAFDHRIWGDPYVLGLIVSSISIQTHPITGKRLSTKDKGFVVLNAMRSLGAPQEACELWLKLAESRDPDYGRGYDDGIAIFIIMAGLLKPEAHHEPDIIAAKDFIPVMRKLNRETALAGAAAGQQDENQELAMAFIHLKVQAHKAAYYP